MGLDMLNDHSAFNKWQCITGTKRATSNSIVGYKMIKKYTKQLKEDTPHAMRELIIGNINEQKNIRKLWISEFDKIVDGLNGMTAAQIKHFQTLKETDYFEAFRYLHRKTL